MALSGPKESSRVLAQIASGTLEPFEVRLFQDAIQPGMTVLDIGANIGYYTLIASQSVGTNGRVFAFEPDPRTAGTLRANVSANGATNVKVIEKAVSDRAGEREFLLSSVAAHSGLHPSMARESLRGSAKVMSVSVDELLAGERVDVIKLDVEGEEPAALRGMARTLAQNPQACLFVELSAAALAAAGAQPEEFVEQLKQHFDEILVIHEDKRSLTPFTASDLDRRRNLLCRPVLRPAGPTSSAS
jgi:FkbM family methyltransferase